MNRNFRDDKIKTHEQIFQYKMTDDVLFKMFFIKHPIQTVGSHL
jgi:hypothetical protein